MLKVFLYIVLTLVALAVVYFGGLVLFALACFVVPVVGGRMFDHE